MGALRQRYRIANAVAEGMHSTIPLIKANAGGFRNFAHSRIAILCHCGGLNLYPHHSWDNLTIHVSVTGTPRTNPRYENLLRLLCSLCAQRHLTPAHSSLLQNVTYQLTRGG